MKILREHDLVASLGRPVRYHLTDKGKELALRLSHTLERESSSEVSRGSVIQEESSPLPISPSPLDNHSCQPIASTLARPRTQSTFLYTYLDGQAKPVERKDQSHVQLYGKYLFFPSISSPPPSFP